MMSKPMVKSPIIMPLEPINAEPTMKLRCRSVRAGMPTICVEYAAGQDQREAQ
jgi:hypothetical protein